MKFVLSNLISNEDLSIESWDVQLTNIWHNSTSWQQWGNLSNSCCEVDVNECWGWNYKQMFLQKIYLSLVKNSRHSLCKTFLNDGLPSCSIPPIYKSFVWSAHCAVLYKLHYLCIIRYELLMDSTMRPNPLCHNRINKPWS